MSDSYDDYDMPSIEETYCNKHKGLWPHECGCSKNPTIVQQDDEWDAQCWIKANDLDYQKYRDRRGDRSAYDSLMNYEISPMLEEAFIAGRKSCPCRK